MLDHEIGDVDDDNKLQNKKKIVNFAEKKKKKKIQSQCTMYYFHESIWYPYLHISICMEKQRISKAYLRDLLL